LNDPSDFRSIPKAEMLATNHLLIQIVPRLTPENCGVSDHAIQLAQELHAAFGVDTAFVVLNSDERCNAPYPVVHCAPSQLLEACLSLSEGRPGALLVHLSGYGYSPDGAPTLLADALANVRADGRFQVAVYFHELFATGMPWKSAFWYSRRQEKAVRRIAEECDLLVTNTRHHANWLEREPVIRSKDPIQLLPVFSTIGESRAPAPVAERDPAIAIFGLAATRQRGYEKLSSLPGLLNDLGIKEICDIGPDFDVPAELNGIPVRRHGTLAAADLASQLSQTRFGFLSHDSFSLAKSSIFAGYCAQGTIPVIAQPFSGEVDGLKDGVHVLSQETVKTSQASGLQRCSTAAWQWYSGHRLHTHAATYARWLDQQESKLPEQRR
jgi:hypothetical protein